VRVLSRRNIACRCNGIGAGDNHLDDACPVTCPYWKLPPRTRAEARAERLEHRLLGGEPPRQALDTIGPITNLIQFGLHETARDQRVARILYPGPHLRDVDQINAVSDDVHRTVFR